MELTSGLFAGFVGLVLLQYYVLPRRAQNYLLLIASYVFYLSWSRFFPLVLLGLTLANFIIAQGLERAGKRFWLWMGVGLNLAALAFFKYADFFVPELLDTLSRLGFGTRADTLRILLPVGLSFYSLQGISYLVDVYRGQLRAATDPVDFALYMAYLLVWAACSLFSAGVAAQQLSPRSFWPAPKGTKVLVFGYSYSTGDVLTDPSLPIYGVDSEIGTGFLGYLQTVALWGRTTNVIVELPYSWGNTKGLLSDLEARRDLSGFADLGVTLSVNLLGAPSMTPADFQRLRANPHPILGVSLKVLAPTGDYDADRLINVGANRWAAKPEFGFLIPLGAKWILELEGGAWFFGDDDNFAAGKREQEPILSAEVHLVRRFRPGFWASLEGNFFTGGQQTIGEVESVVVQRNSRIGVTVVVPFRGRHAIKVGYSGGVVTEFGSDYRQFLVSYQVVFR